MQGSIKCTATIFGEFSHYDINTESILRLLNLFKEFEVVPNVIKQVSFEVSNKDDKLPSAKTFDRVQLNSSKNLFLVNILDNKVEIEAQPYIEKESGVSKIDLTNFISNVKNIFELLFNELDCIGNRISFIITYLDSTDVSKKYDKYIKPTEYYKNKEVIEWSTRSVTRERISINDTYEEINIVSNIFRTKGRIDNSLPAPTVNEFDGVLQEIDINTLAENEHYRIDSDFVDIFYGEIIKKLNKIREVGENDEE